MLPTIDKHEFYILIHFTNKSPPSSFTQGTEQARNACFIYVLGQLMGKVSEATEMQKNILSSKISTF